MMFSFEEEVRDYYIKYAKQMGFVISKSSHVGDDEKLRYFTLAYVREGKSKSKASNILKPRPGEKMCCKAKINHVFLSLYRSIHCLQSYLNTHVLGLGKAQF